jgi:hypothetical protein
LTPRHFVSMIIGHSADREVFFMHTKLARMLLPLVLLAAIAAVTIGSTCCTPELTVPDLMVGGMLPIPSMTIPAVCF